MKEILDKTRELLKNKTFEEQLEIMFQIRKKIFKIKSFRVEYFRYFR